MYKRMSSSTLTFREVDATDYDAVMSILPDAWENRDYLPDKYHEYVADPDIRCFACEIDGEMVGFHAALIVDGGERMVRIGGRVKVTHQGQGIFHALLRHIYKAYSDDARLKWESIVVVDTHAERIRQQYVVQRGYTEVLHKKRYLYNFSPTNLDLTGTCLQSRRVQTLTGSALAAMFSMESVCRRLFPDGRIFLHCKPYRTMTSNIRHFTHNTIILTTGDKNYLPCRNGNPEDHKSSAQSEDDLKRYIATVQLVSIGNSYNQKYGLHYNIELYGDDMETFPSHFERHLEHLMSTTTSRSVDVVVHTHVQTDVTCIDEAVGKYGVKRSTSYVEAVRVFERPFSLAMAEVDNKN